MNASSGDAEKAETVNTGLVFLFVKLDWTMAFGVS